MEKILSSANDFKRYSLRRHWTKISNSIVDDPSLSCQEKLIYITLKRFDFHNTGCFPGHKLLSEILNFSKSQIKRILRSLKHKGWIVPEKRGRRNFYRLLK